MKAPPQVSEVRIGARIHACRTWRLDVRAFRHWVSVTHHSSTALWRNSIDDRASQIAEFAVSLPLLVLFVVGIFDFSGALSLKQKLTNAAREAARVAAADPANDLGNSLPASVIDAFYVVDNYLLSEKINDCGLATTRPTSSGNLVWTSTAVGCPGGASNGLILTINRGCWTPQIGGQTAVDVINTCVTIRYPYTWKFTGLAGLFGGRFSPTSGITTTSVAFNEN